MFLYDIVYKFLYPNELNYLKKKINKKLLTGIYSSNLPPGNTPNNLGPFWLSESNVNITDSVINVSRALSPLTCP